ncbi:hypothetical protein ADL26_19440, partial [Thermoactinomyces vulgaris]
ALDLGGVAAVALQRTVDGADRLAEAGVVDDGVVGGHGAGAVLGVPVPEAGLPRHGRVLLDQVRVGEEVDAQGVTGGLVVEVPAELDGAAAVVGGLAGRAAVGLRGVAV